MQGMGWACLEELKWGDRAHPWIPKGRLFTNGPGSYKIPSADDIPRDFRVKLLQNVPNVRAVHSSKAVGEPPFHLGATVLFALRNAIAAARAESGALDFLFFIFLESLKCNFLSPMLCATIAHSLCAVLGGFDFESPAPCHYCHLKDLSDFVLK
jgi:hypothetical protein